MIQSVTISALVYPAQIFLDDLFIYYVYILEMILMLTIL